MLKTSNVGQTPWRFLQPVADLVVREHRGSGAMGDGDRVSDMVIVVKSAERSDASRTASATSVIWLLTA